MILTDYTCGGIKNFVFDGQIPTITSTIVTLIMIGIPVLLIIFGMLDLGKAVMAQKEDEIKKGQQTFLKRLMAAAIVFFIVFIVKIVVGLIAPDGADGSQASNKNITNCIDCFISGTNKCEKQ